MVNASGVLITVPLLALSIMTSRSEFSKAAILAVAVPTLMSSVLFATSIYFIIRSLRLTGWPFLFPSTLTDEVDAGAATPSPSPSTMTYEARRSAIISTRWGTDLFQLGIGFLVLSIFALVIELVA